MAYQIAATPMTLSDL